LDLLIKVATPPKLTKVDYDAFTAKFKNLLTHYSLNNSQGGNTEKC
jgi:hypothetical protein